MNVETYTTEKSGRENFYALLERVYQDWPRVLAEKKADVTKSFNQVNPFLHSGEWKNFYLVDNKQVVAHVSAIVDHRMPAEVGLVGFFEASSNEAGRRVLSVAEDWHRQHGRKVLRGPINFTIWGKFRLTCSEDQPPYALEPFSRSFYTSIFVQSGWHVVHQNVSTLGSIESMAEETGSRALTSCRAEGYTFMRPTAATAGDALRSAYTISMKTFTDAWNYVSIPFEEFVYSFLSDNQHMDYRLIDIVSDTSQQPLAFLFGVPDMSIPSHPRAVIKTLAVIPEAQAHGIGSALLHRFRISAMEMGIGEVIYSTMRTDNQAILTLTGQGNSVYRTYQTFERRLV